MDRVVVGFLLTQSYGVKYSALDLVRGLSVSGCANALAF